MDNTRARRRNILALIESPQHVCYRYRFRAFASALEAAGWSASAVVLARGTWARLQQLRHLPPTDVVILQRRLLPARQVRMLRRATRCLIYDVDDAVFLRDSYSGRSPQSRRRARRFQAIVQCADRVLAGNRFLADQATRWTDTGRVRVLPTCIDPRLYPLAEHQRRSMGMELAWIGSRSTVRCFEHCKGLLEAVGRRLPGLRLRVVCDAYPRLPHIEVVPRPWSEQTEARELAQAEIGISWLPDDLWSRGKCGLKVLQYMAAGLPVVANPVGVQTKMVRHGETGYLATTPQQWCEAISLLVDPQERRRMGLAGRRWVEQHYNVHRWAEVLIQVLRELSPHAGKPHFGEIGTSQGAEVSAGETEVSGVKFGDGR